MMRKVYLNIVLLLAFAYGSYGVIEHAHVYFTPSHWQYYYYGASPWALLYGSLKAWHRSFTWRRMAAQRYAAPVLSRGEHRAGKKQQGQNILEYASAGLLLLSIAAILTQFGASHIAWWIGSLMGTWIALRLTLKRVTRP
ncbi:MAG: hypothetical protein AB2692_23555 [Candidatus Thiodiazotropha sp.]